MLITYIKIGKFYRYFWLIILFFFFLFFLHFLCSFVFIFCIAPIHHDPILACESWPANKTGILIMCRKNQHCFHYDGVGCKQAWSYIGHVGEGDVVDVLGGGVCGQVGPAGQSLGAKGLQEALRGLQRHQLLALQLGPGPTHRHGSGEGKSHTIGGVHRRTTETLCRPANGCKECPGLQSSREMLK